MPNERETPRPDSQPKTWPDPGTLMNAMQELPETFLLAWQQVMAGAPTTWSAQWSLGESRFPGAPQEPSSADRSEPQHQAFSRMQAEALDFWMRPLRSFARGLAMPTRDGRS